MRSYHGRNRRAVQRSRDGGLSWSALEFDEALIEPVCQASMISMGKRLLFSNPAATTRTRMTVRLSDDDGRTWTASRLLYEGPSAYSSLAVLRDRSIGLLFEYGEKSPYERIAFTRLRIAVALPSSLYLRKRLPQPNARIETFTPVRPRVREGRGSGPGCAACT